MFLFVYRETKHSVPKPNHDHSLITYPFSITSESTSKTMSIVRFQDKIQHLDTLYFLPTIIRIKFILFSLQFLQYFEQVLTLNQLTVDLIKRLRFKL